MLKLQPLAVKQIISMILCSIRYESSSPFLGVRFVLSMFLNFGNVSASISYRKCSHKKIDYIQMPVTGIRSLFRHRRCT